jgi:hypothetical protein
MIIGAKERQQVVLGRPRPLSVSVSVAFTAGVAVPFSLMDCCTPCSVLRLLFILLRLLWRLLMAFAGLLDRFF